MENMKLFEHPEVLEFDQRGEKVNLNTLSLSPIVPFHVHVLFQFQVAVSY